MFLLKYLEVKEDEKEVLNIDFIGDREVDERPIFSTLILGENRIIRKRNPNRRPAVKISLKYKIAHQLGISRRICIRELETDFINRIFPLRQVNPQRIARLEHLPLLVHLQTGTGCRMQQGIIYL